VKTVFLFVLLPVLAFSIYPYLSHPPFWIFEDGLVVVDFELEKPSSASLTILTGEDEFVLEDSTSLHHRIKVPVKGSFSYRMRCCSKEFSGQVVYPSKNLKSFKVLVVGDCRGGTKVFKEIVKKGKRADFMLFLGDVAYTDMNDGDWRGFFEGLSDFGRVVFTVKGNHEFPGFRYSLYLYPSDYTFRIGSWRFFVLNSNTLSSLLIAVLKRMFEKYEGEGTKKVVVFHHPVLSCERFRFSHLFASPSDDVLKLLKKWKVKLVFSSHSHNYQRLERDGITFLVVGGGGAPVHEIRRGCEGLVKGYSGYSYVMAFFDERGVSFSVYDLSGRLLDEFRVEY